MVSTPLVSRRLLLSCQTESLTSTRRMNVHESECCIIDLQTDCLNCIRHMPPTGPFGSLPRVAVVFARLVVQGEDRGVRPFLVALGDGNQMCKGVTSRYALYPRPNPNI